MSHINCSNHIAVQYFAMKPAPEFLAWLEGSGIYRDMVELQSLEGGD